MIHCYGAPMRALLLTCLFLCWACGDDDEPDARPDAAADARDADAAPGDGDAGSIDAAPPGALVRVTTASEVGVLLDELPTAMRDRVATDLLARPDEFWIERARWQLRLTSIRLVYRKYYFAEEEQDAKDALPLPPEEVWRITLDGEPTRTAVGDRDYVKVAYRLESTIVTDQASPGRSEPMLDTVGGTWDEAFVFPIDPTLLFQRTGYACMSEDQFPPESVDAEDAFRFYDDTCEVEREPELLCHHTEPLPSETCIEALERVVGKVDAAIHYERIAFDESIAAMSRHADVTTPDSPDLAVLTTGEGLNDNRVIYKYIADDHCAVIERCVDEPGWRRLLIFDSHDHNVGGKPIEIGAVDYTVEGLGSDLIAHGVYDLSECHRHYHFNNYGSFSFSAAGTSTVRKNGFCLESTDRLSNHELSPMQQGYSCEFQGVQAGWGDLYGSSLTCNWVDVTDVDTGSGSVMGELTFRSNPDGFICEGTPVLDAMGDQVWEPTSEQTASGMTVDRPLCMQAEGAEENDVGTVEVTLAQRGGFVTAPCDGARAHDIGPLRNCGFAMQPDFVTCTAGEMTTLSCSGATAMQPQVVRVCETSRVLGTGVDCTHVDALANAVIAAGATDVTFRCPRMRDAMETGGQVALYVAPVFEPDGSRAVVCTN